MTTSAYTCTRPSCDGAPLTGACKTGLDQYFWVAWPCYDAAADDEHPAHGYAATVEEAEVAITRAMGSTGPFRPRSRHATGASYARGYLRRLAVERRAQRTSTATNSASLEFVYQHGINEYDGRDTWTPYRIVKKTASRVYVEDAPHYEPHEPILNTANARAQRGWRRYDVRTFTLDRLALERDGSAARRGKWWSTYYTETGKTLWQADRSAPACLAALGLRQPCTLADVKRAYRQRARATHPDAGGDAAAFITLQSAYEQALGLIGGAA